VELESFLRDLAPAVDFGWPGRLFVFVLLVIVPLLALYKPDEREISLPPRTVLYASAAMGVWILALLTGVVLWVERLPPPEVGLFPTGLGAFCGWTATATIGTLGGSLLISRLAARLGIRESRLTYHLMPRSPRERWWFLGVSISAGFCEEISYHGFLLAGLSGWLQNGWWAAVVANLAFAVMHGYQGQIGVIRAFAMGYMLCLPVVVGAGLLPAMAAHFLVNALLGFGLWKWMVPPDKRPPED
jgi:membrane protease YdiL (CAAX protease family)